MAITYPLTLPTTPVPSRMVMRALNSTAISRSPFTFEQQVFEHQGGMWSAEMSLPPMDRAAAEAWISTLLKLRGLNGTFLLPPYAAKVPRGIATGSPQVDGDGQTGLTLATLGWTASQIGILLAGDYLQVMKNYLTFPEAFDNAIWAKTGTAGPPVVTADDQIDPTGVLTADKVDFPATGVGTFSDIRQQTTPLSVQGQTLDFGIWVKGPSAVTLKLFMHDFPQTDTPVNNVDLDVTTSWVYKRFTGTFGSTANPDVRVLMRNEPSQAAKTVFMWGPSLSSPQDAHLHKVLNDADSDSNGLATFDIWPRLRQDPKDHADIIVQTPVGLFRLASNQSEWDISTATIYGMGISAQEAI